MPRLGFSQKTARRDLGQRHNICRFVFYKGRSWLQGGEYIGKASLRAPRRVRSKMEPPREETRAAAETESHEWTPQTLGRQQQRLVSVNEWASFYKQRSAAAWTVELCRSAHGSYIKSFQPAAGTTPSLGGKKSLFFSFVNSFISIVLQRQNN